MTTAPLDPERIDLVDAQTKAEEVAMRAAEVISYARIAHEASSTLKSEEGIANRIDKRDHRERLKEHLKHKIMAEVPDEQKDPEAYEEYAQEFSGRDGELLKPINFRERRMDKKITRKGLAYKRSAAVHGYRAKSFSVGNSGKPAKIENTLERFSIRTDKNLSALDKHLGVLESRANPRRLGSPPMYRAEQKMSDKKYSYLVATKVTPKSLEKSVTKRDSDVADIADVFKKRQEAQEKQELAKVKRDIFKADVEVGKKARSHNRRAKLANSKLGKRSPSVRRVAKNLATKKRAELADAKLSAQFIRDDYRDLSILTPEERRELRKLAD